MWFALQAAKHLRVTILTKDVPEESNSRYAQGGIAAVWSDDDAPENHVRDTMVAGASLNRRQTVEVTVREGPDRIRDLIAVGTEFTRRSDSEEYSLHREGGHSHRRILHSEDLTGAELVRALGEACAREPNIEFLEHHMAIDLITKTWLARRTGQIPPPQDEVVGAYVLDTRSAEVVTFSAKTVVLATGGAGKVYLYTTNPSIATGDGMAMAYRAGARVANMEFVQFHPTCLYHPKVTSFLISEALRGEGGRLVLPSGQRFMPDYDERGELALATGGAGKVYLYTTNPSIATGDGMAMAYRAGARVANMEFVQFHPTCLYHPKVTSFLISEALRGEGGRLVLPSGQRFMPDYDERGELAPRDIVARAIDSELKRRGLDCVYLDMSHLTREQASSMFPNIDARLLALGIDMTCDPIPVVPAAHYFCGGVSTDLHGRTSVGNLFAVGETACTGLHGANRLASNSLLEAVVFGHRAAKAAVDQAAQVTQLDVLPPWDSSTAKNPDELVVIQQVWEEIRRFMWNYVGIVRTHRRLKRARRRIRLVQEEINDYYWDFKVTGDLIELRNLAMVAEMVVTSALLRRESRGLHYTLDFPDSDTRFIRDTIIQRSPD